MIYVKAEPNGWTQLGRLGENEYRTVCFDEALDVFEQIPDAAVTVLHQRPGDPAAYPVAPEFVTVEDEIVYWQIQSGDLARAGTGRCELVFTSGGVVAKSLIYNTKVMPALDGSGDPPAPWVSWVQEVVAATGHYPMIRNGNWWVWNLSQGAFVDTGVQAQGPQGDPGEDYVITQENIEEIGGMVIRSETVSDMLDDMEGAIYGTHHGDPIVDPTDPHYENSAEYYKDQCEELVGDLALEETQQAILDEAEDANALLRQIVDNPLETLAHTSERYAKGTEDGVAVESGVGYHDNSKYYKEQTEALATEVQQMTGTLAQETTLLAVKSEAEQATELLEDMVEAGTKYGQPSAATDGVYILQATVSNGAITYAWVSAS